MGPPIREAYWRDGVLMIDEQVVCSTLENAQNCLPSGRYSVRLGHSEVFRRKVPILINKQNPTIKGCLGFGNGAYKLRDGTILVGESDVSGLVIHSHKTFLQLYNRIAKALERGKDVHERKKDLSQITKTQQVDPESNYCFGEGGAGAYSDGKLYTRSKKRGNIEKILNVFCQHGASTNILADAHPHIGTDKLPRVIENMRNTILRCGGEVHFQTKMTRFIIDHSPLTIEHRGGEKVMGVEAVKMVNGQWSMVNEFLGPVILATGHSARDVYRYLAESHIEIEAKGIAVGVRLEHPSMLIDQIQYHNKQGRGKYLPAAEYSFVTQVDGRGVYSFCMCPGGFVIPAATDKQQIVVNGMSPSNRGGQWSNSGMVVELRPEDLQGVMSEDSSPLAMMHFQEQLERDCWQQGNMRQTAPAQRMADFVNKRLSYDLPRSSYAPGLISSPLHFWLPESISHRLQEGFKFFGKHCHGFLTNEAVMIGVETRTSSPVRIVRSADTLMHVRLQGLFPCGEGAGYAGGIVSAGVDGERCAEMCAAYLES